MAPVSTPPLPGAPRARPATGEPLASAAGAYVLILTARKRAAVRVGSLGELAVRPGVYAYVGSARGPGGVAARVARHLRPAVRPHWHLDYLRPLLQAREAWWLAGEENREHVWAGRLARLDAASMPLRRFGASDCRCPSHLFYFRRRPQPGALEESALNVTPVAVPRRLRPR